MLISTKKNVDTNITVTHKEELSHWPESLLSIGTFGTYDFEATKQDSFASNNKIVEPDLSDFTSEEVAALLKKLENMGTQRWTLTKDQFMDCSTSLIDPNCDDYKQIFSESEIVLSKGKDLLNGLNSVLRKKSISVFVKKLFACRGGFAHVPSPELRDPFSQLRMENVCF
jgi:hypothetical protein